MQGLVLTNDECAFIYSQSESVHVHISDRSLNTNKGVQLFEVLLGQFCGVLICIHVYLNNHFLGHIVLDIHPFFLQ